MSNKPTSDVAFTAAVKAIQERLGSRRSYSRMEQAGGWSDTVDENLATFLAERDSFYLGSATADGQPYIQHRGGKPGFLKVIDERTLAFADFRGNRQYISMGNFSENDRAFIFAMDYPNRRRVKLWGRVEVIENDESLMRRVADEGDDGKPERVFLFHLTAWDVNCPQHIEPRFSQRELQPWADALRQENQELRQQLAELEKRLAEHEG